MEITPNTHVAAPGNGKLHLEGIHFQFPKFNQEKQAPIINVNEVVDEQRTLGARVSDSVAATVGSWRFIIIQSIILAIWITLNSIAWAYRWDIYPFILLNLVLSFQAAYSAPFVMMSQNRQAQKDRLTAENDYRTDVKGEQEICHVIEHLDHQDKLILQVVEHLEKQNLRIDQQEQLIIQLVQKIDGQQQFMKAQHLEILQMLSGHNGSSQE